ncbi:hypothetical protein JCM3766R1_002728 [Sporobolomyces carnicolor]
MSPAHVRRTSSFSDLVIPISTSTSTSTDFDFDDSSKRALGPASGRDFLARATLTRQATVGDDESGFSIRERIPIRPFIEPPTTTSTSQTSRRKPAPSVEEEETPRATTTTTTKTNRPPISGLNQIDPRGRSNSTGSSSSVSKDAILRDLGDAIRKERRRRQLFQAETVKAQSELNEIASNLVVMREQFATIDEQQELTIKNLETEIRQVEQELATADLLDDDTAKEYLSLLSNQSLSHLARSKREPPVASFDPCLLRSTSLRDDDEPPVSSLNRSLSRFGFTRPNRALVKLKRAPDSTTRSRADVESTSPTLLRRSHHHRSTSPSPHGDGVAQPRRHRFQPPPPPPRPVFPPIDSQVFPRFRNELQRDREGDVVDTRGDSPRATRKSSFKRRFSGTMRVLFPSNATTSKGSSEGKRITNWLRAA